MVKTGQPKIRGVEFASGRHAALPVEVVGYSDLIDRMGRTFFARPDRPTFDIAILVNGGSGLHQVDFEQIPLVPGRLIRIRPGQVQTWSVSADTDATVLLSKRGPGYWDKDASCDLGAGSLAIAKSIIAAVEVEQHRFDGSEPSERLMLRLFEAIDALFDRAHRGRTSGQPAAYRAFRDAIEADLGASHHVADYAQALPFSERTISRACQHVTGLTAKGVLNQRLTLEAKRLLAHTDLAAATIGRQLGFNEATNFHKFFSRQASQRPAEFRTSQPGRSKMGAT